MLCAKCLINFLRMHVIALFCYNNHGKFIKQCNIHYIVSLKFRRNTYIIQLLGQNKKIPVFRVTQPYLVLLVKPRFYFRFSGKKYFYAF